jgi:predicted RND superfamily exporter protein
MKHIIVILLLSFGKLFAQNIEITPENYQYYVKNNFDRRFQGLDYVVYGTGENSILIFNEGKLIKSFFLNNSMEILDSMLLEKTKVWNLVFEPKSYRKLAIDETQRKSSKKIYLYLRKKDGANINLVIPVLIGHGYISPNQEFPISKKVHTLLFNHLLKYQVNNKN